MRSEEHMRLLLPYNKVLADLGQKTITTTLIDEAWNQQTYDRFRSCVQATKRADGSWAYDYTLFDKIVKGEVAVDGSDVAEPASTDNVTMNIVK